MILTQEMGNTVGTCGGTNCLYAMGNRQDQKIAPDVVTSILRIFTFDCYALLDPGATLSFVTPYVASKFGILPECLLEPFVVSTTTGKSILAERVYINCVVSIYHRDTLADLVELEMVDFDIILGMDWLHACYASLTVEPALLSSNFL